MNATKLLSCRMHMIKYAWIGTPVSCQNFVHYQTRNLPCLVQKFGHRYCHGTSSENMTNGGANSATEGSGTSAPSNSAPSNGSRRKLEVGYEELKSLLDSHCDDIVLVDVREPRELQQDGKIEQAVNIPLCELKRTLSLESEHFEDAVGLPKPDNRTSLVFYGRKAVKGLAASEIASKLGYKKVMHYPGGFDEWKKKESASG